jgi:hypothetical protein
MQALPADCESSNQLLIWRFACRSPVRIWRARFLPQPQFLAKLVCQEKFVQFERSTNGSQKRFAAVAPLFLFHQVKQTQSNGMAVRSFRFAPFRRHLNYYRQWLE